MPRMMDHLFYSNPHVSPTAHHALHKACEPYVLYITNHSPLFVSPDANLEKQEPWPRMLKRKYRLFHADITLNAPKDRTLFNYNIKDGWPKLRKFLGLPEGPEDEKFPHENKAGGATDFWRDLWTGTEYADKVAAEVAAYMKQNGYECKVYTVNLLINKNKTS